MFLHFSSPEISFCFVWFQQFQTRASFLLTGSLQIGFLGSLSTVSTFVVELKNLWEKAEHRGRAYLYLVLSLGLSLILGLIIYNVPVWVAPLQSHYVRVEGCNLVFS